MYVPLWSKSITSNTIKLDQTALPIKKKWIKSIVKISIFIRKWKDWAKGKMEYWRKVEWKLSHRVEAQGVWRAVRKL